MYSDCTTVYALAIRFGLLDEPTSCPRRGSGSPSCPRRPATGSRPGSPARPFITDALTQTGHLDDAYKLLLERECPSWLYPVTMGATTIWERWDSMLPDGDDQPRRDDVLQPLRARRGRRLDARVVGGLAPSEPGYSRVLGSPRNRAADSPGGDHARDTARPVAVRWEVSGEGLQVDVDLPEGVEGDLVLPGVDPVVLGSGRHTRTLESVV